MGKCRAPRTNRRRTRFARHGRHAQNCGQNKIDILHALLASMPARGANGSRGKSVRIAKRGPPSCGLSDQAFPHAIQRRELLGNFNDFRPATLPRNRLPVQPPLPACAARPFRKDERPPARAKLLPKRAAYISPDASPAGRNEDLCGWHRFARRNDRLIIGGQRSARSAARWFKGRAQLLILVLKLVKAVINPAQGEQFLVRTLLSEASLCGIRVCDRHAGWC